MAQVSKTTITQDFVKVSDLVDKLQELDIRNAFNDMPMEYISVSYLYDIIDDLKINQEVELDIHLVDNKIEAN